MRDPKPLWTLPPSPYINHTRIDRLVWWGVFLALPRALLVLATVLLSWLLAECCLLGWNDKDERPLTSWRKVVRWPIPWLIRVNLFALGIHLVEEVGRPASRQEAPILVANHQGFLDVFYLQYKITGIGLSAAENGKQPLMGTIMRCMQTIMVERGDKNQGQNAIEKVVRIAQDDRWPPVCIFPEGNTSNGRQICSFKRGAFVAGLPIQPIVIQYDMGNLDPSWVEPHGHLPHVLAFLLMCRWSNRMKVTFLPVMKPTTMEMEDPDLFAERVRSAMAEVLGVPKTEHGFDDTRLMFAAKKIGLLPSEAVIETGKVRREWGFDYKMCRFAMERYMMAASKGTCRIGPKEFACAIGLDATYSSDRNLQEIFDAFDQDEDGLLSYREFLAGLASWTNDKFKREERVNYALEALRSEVLP